MSKRLLMIFLVILPVSVLVIGLLAVKTSVKPELNTNDLPPVPSEQSENTYILAGNEVVESTKNGKKVLFNNVENVSDVRSGPDGVTLHFKQKDANYKERQQLCAEIKAPIEPTPRDYDVPYSSVPPWDYKKLGWAYTARYCNGTEFSGGFLKSSHFFVYLVLTDTETGTLYYEDTSTSEVKSISLNGQMLKGFNDGTNYFITGKSDRGNSYWMRPVMGADGKEYFYPQRDAYIGRTLILAFGTLILSVDNQKNALVGWHVQNDVVATSFWFLTDKNSPFVVVESAWEGPALLNGIIDVTAGTHKFVDLSDLDKRPFLDFDIKELEWSGKELLFNFTDFEEISDKLPDSFNMEIIGNSEGEALDKYNKDAEEYLSKNSDYTEVKCSLQYGMYSGCAGLKKINRYKYTSDSGLVKI